MHTGKTQLSEAFLLHNSKYLDTLLTFLYELKECLNDTLGTCPCACVVGCARDQNVQFLGLGQFLVTEG